MLGACAVVGAVAGLPLAHADDVPKADYVVLMDDEGSQASAEAALSSVMGEVRRENGVVGKVYQEVMTGFSAELDPAAAADLRKLPGVASVTPSKTHQVDPAPATAGGSQALDLSATKSTKSKAPWQLDRIDQRRLPLDGAYSPPKGTDGRGVDVYVVDSGIRSTHTEFGGRVTGVYSSINDGRGTEDCAGHGTFVASQIGGAVHGVAKKVNLKAVRMLDCNNRFTDAQALEAFDWMYRNVSPPAIVNMSLQSAGGDSSPLLDAAVAKLIDKGLIVVLITGNYNRGDCQNSPKDSRAITVGATTRDDKRNTGLNASSYGPCTTVFAPGADVSGAGISSNTAVMEKWYGTSFAAPLVSGALALRMQTQRNLTWAKAKSYIVQTATPGVLTDLGQGSPNRLLHQPAASKQVK